MAIEIHIRVKESDWDSEHELANQLAEEIQDHVIIPNNVNIKILVFPVEDKENEMESLIKEDEQNDESKYLQARDRADKAEQTEW